MKTFTYNDRQGNRDRQCFTRLLTPEGIVLNTTEQKESQLIKRAATDYEKNGKWSNSTYAVKIAEGCFFFVYMTPFDGWSKTWDSVVKQLIEECKAYKCDVPTEEQARLIIRQSFAAEFVAKLDDFERGFEVRRFHAIRNSLGGYSVIPTSSYNNQGDPIFTGSEDECWEAIEKDKGL